jgi:hypothetical protein
MTFTASDSNTANESDGLPIALIAWLFWFVVVAHLIMAVKSGYIFYGTWWNRNEHPFFYWGNLSLGIITAVFMFFMLLYFSFN